VSPHGAVELITPEGDQSFNMNGQRVKPYLGGELPKERVGFVLTDLSESLPSMLVTVKKRWVGGNPPCLLSGIVSFIAFQYKNKINVFF